MSQKVTFSKVTLLSFSRKVEHGTAKFSAMPSKAVSKSMGWGDFPEWQKSGQPEGMLAASLAELMPSDSALAKHSIELAVSSVRDFELVRLQSNKGKSSKKVRATKTELHFSMDFSDPTGARKLEEYMQVAGESTLRVTYEKQAELDLTPEGDLEQLVIDTAAKRRAAGDSEE
jgi:hypothetical protein